MLLMRGGQELLFSSTHYYQDSSGHRFLRRSDFYFHRIGHQLNLIAIVYLPVYPIGINFIVFTICSSTSWTGRSTSGRRAYCRRSRCAQCRHGGPAGRVHRPRGHQNPQRPT